MKPGGSARAHEQMFEKDRDNFIKKYYGNWSGVTWERAPRSQADGVAMWTSKAYKGVQDMRRRGHPAPTMNTGAGSSGYSADIATKINARIATYMQRKALRAPSIPRGIDPAPTVLLRGLHGPLAKKIISQKYLVDDGYIAFTRNPFIAKRFAKSQWYRRFAGTSVILVLVTSMVPAGTPWIWFQGDSWELPPDSSKTKRRYTGMDISEVEEGEVLMPPGRLVIVGRVTGKEKKSIGLSNSPVPIYKVMYYPDASAKSLTGKRIMLKPGRPHLNSEAPDTNTIALNMYRALYK